MIMVLSGSSGWGKKRPRTSKYSRSRGRRSSVAGGLGVGDLGFDGGIGDSVPKGQAQHAESHGDRHLGDPYHVRVVRVASGERGRGP